MRGVTRCVLRVLFVVLVALLRHMDEGWTRRANCEGRMRRRIAEHARAKVVRRLSRVKHDRQATGRDDPNAAYAQP